ncbi:MAG: sugar transferase [Candidatus Paceibacteria bacterium]
MGLRRVILIFGDIAVFYAALIFTLFIRWGFVLNKQILEAHILPFSLILVAGLLMFYSMRLYDPAFGYGSPLWLKSAATAIGVQFIIAVLFFYFWARSSESISPRGTLFLFFIVFTTFFTGWRGLVEKYRVKQKGERIIIFANVTEAGNLAEWLYEHPELGYHVVAILPEENLDPKRLAELIKEENLQTVITSKRGLERLVQRGRLQELSKFKVNFWDLVTFYEIKLGKIPVNLVSDAWILENVVKHENPLEAFLKSVVDFVFAWTLLILTLPIWPFVALGIKLSSPGPIFYKHRRVGQYGKEFILKKFRSMYQDAEKSGPRWAQPDDERVTSFGRFIRNTHLDELPQLLSIIKGDLSFVGPRPERPEFVKELTDKIPFYDVRHLIKPGFTGWAQINYPYGASIEDAKEKLEYDLYYLKHRSLLLDISIILKTIRLLFYNPQK